MKDIFSLLDCDFDTAITFSKFCELMRVLKH